MNEQLRYTIDLDKSNICDYCGDLIEQGQPHYATSDKQFILCPVCAVHTKE